MKESSRVSFSRVPVQMKVPSASSNRMDATASAWLGANRPSAHCASMWVKQASRFVS